MKRYLQITAGRGPEECCFAVAQVLKKLIKSFKNVDCHYEVIHREPSHINGNLFSASLWVDLKRKPELLDEWIGTIQWISESPFRPHHRRKNWFVGVFEIDSSSLPSFDEKDLRFETFRSSGPGGQNVNKVSSGVRAIHEDSGLSVKVMDTRSQSQNKRLAIERIERLWNEFQMEKIKNNQERMWINHLDLQRGNPVRVFRSKDFKVKTKPKKFKDQRGKEKQRWKRDL